LASALLLLLLMLGVIAVLDAGVDVYG